MKKLGLMNQIQQKLSIDEFESNLGNNVISKSEEFNESSRRDSRFMRPTHSKLFL